MEQTSGAGFLNYHHLRYFWAVAREGSLRAASEALRVSQPSICSQIQLLEAALGEELFRPRGRSLALTEFGELVYGYAQEIFALGGELLSAAKHPPAARSLRLGVGIVDSFPKLMSYEILRPAFEGQAPVLLTCHEGKLSDLLALLTAHRLDLVLADEPASPGVAGKVFNHPLYTCGVSFLAMPSLARVLKGRFPRNLNGAPALLPTQNCNLRRDLEKWFRGSKLQPKVVGEFEDAALAKIVATAGAGFIAVPTLVEREAIERYGFLSLGRTRAVESQFFAITVERKLTHPVVLAITVRKAGRG